MTHAQAIEKLVDRYGNPFFWQCVLTGRENETLCHVCGTWQPKHGGCGRDDCPQERN